MRKSSIPYLSLPLILFSNTLLAKGGPSPSGSAGIVERAIEQEYRVEDLQPRKEIPILEVDVPQKTLDIPEGVKAYIEHIEVESTSVLSDKELKQVIAPYLNRELTGKDVEKLCLEIDQLYANKGYIFAWTYPPVQKIENHTLKLEVLESLLGEIIVIGNTSYSSEYIRKYFNSMKNKPLNYDDLIQAFLLLNENLELNASGVLKKGKTRGSIDLIIRVKDKTPAQVSMSYNNWGSTVTTPHLLGSQIELGNILMSGDTLTLMTSMGLPPVIYYINPVYSIPLNGSGAKIGLSYLFSWSATQQFKELDLTSWSEVGTVAYSQPLQRTKVFDADFFASFDFKQFKNLQQGYTSSIDKLRVVDLGFSMDYIDAVKGRNFFSNFFHIGIPYILGGSPPISNISSNPGRGGGRYFIYNVNFQRIQPLPKDCSLLLTTSAQGTFNSLPMPEQFSIGGIGTVRGYQASVVAGDIGYFGNLEFYIPPPFFGDTVFKPFKKPWKEILQFLAFLDHGGVYTNAAVEGEPSPAYLTGAGAGIRFYGPKALTVSFDAGFPLTKQHTQYDSFFYVRVNMNFL